MRFGLKITPADIVFSKLVRHYGKNTCVRCKRVHEEGSNNLDNSHYWGRSFKSVKWDWENCDPLCRYPCHQGKDSSNLNRFGWEYQKQIKGYNGARENGAYTQFKINQLGQNRFDRLMLRAHAGGKTDEFSIHKVLKKEWLAIENKNKSEILGSR